MLDIISIWPLSSRRPVAVIRNRVYPAVELGMTSERGIYLIANILVNECGPAPAPLMAAKRADALLDLGDVDGQRVWKGVLRAVQELIRSDRKPGERVN
jgi:hypothetical protein